MAEPTTTGTGYPQEQGYAADEARVSVANLMGQVMFLVAVAIAFTALGTWLGRDLEVGTARICSFAGLGMLLIASFAPGRTFRVGAFAIGWLYATGLLIGLGLGPAIEYFTQVDETALTQAAGGTALTVVGMGAIGFIMSHDLARWMRPLSYIVLAGVAVSIVLLMTTGGGAHPLISLAIYAASALLIMVNFNFLRKHGTEDHVVMLATGIFVSIVNIFVSLLNLFGGD